MIRRFRDLGFDTARTWLAFRTAVAACIAVFLAWLLGLDHPQWAGMTVWAATQPMRGQLLEKSFFRIAGTVSGTIAGVCLVLASTIEPAFLVIGLAAWVGACTFIGNLQRGFVSYGTVLAGYTAAMVSLLDVGHPDDVMALGFDRMATVLTGVVVATVVGYFFSPETNRDALVRRVRELVADILRATATATPLDPGEKRKLVARVAEIEVGLDPHSAGSFRSRKETKAIRGLLTNTLPLLLNHGDCPPNAAAVADLEAAARHLARNEPDEALVALERAVSGLDDGGEPYQMLQRLQFSFAEWVRVDAAPVEQGRPRVTPIPVVLHRDWVGARESMIRASGGLLFFGAIWLMTGWSVGGFMLLGLSIMLSLFSTFDNPAGMMRFVFLGQILGVAGALACRWLVWPFATNEFQMILMMMPFILIGPLFVGHRRTVAVSFDYNMVMLLMLQPHFPLTGTFPASVVTGLAVIAAPFAAFLSYKFIFPVSLRRKRDTVVNMMLRDLADLAGAADALQHRAVWQARFYHRTLRMVRLAEMAGREKDTTLDLSLSLFDLGEGILQCHSVLQDPQSGTSSRRAARYALARAGNIAAQPEQAGQAMARLGRRLHGHDADLLCRADLAVARLTSLKREDA